MYNTFGQEQKRSWRKKRFRVENWLNAPDTDEYTCPNLKTFTYQRSYSRRTDNGFRDHGSTICLFRL
jgi:hypothetical protein